LLLSLLKTYTEQFDYIYFFISMKFIVFACFSFYTAQLLKFEYDIEKSKHLCYKFFTWNTNTDLASHECGKDKARLLTIRDLDVLSFLQDKIRNNLILCE